MLVIRLLRTGRKNQATFKIVVVEKERASTSGSFIEEVGFYNPRTKEKVLKGERIKYWLSVGAKPSVTVHNLLVSEKMIEGGKIKIHLKKKKKETETKTEAPMIEEKPVTEITPAVEEVKEEIQSDETKEEKPEIEGSTEEKSEKMEEKAKEEEIKPEPELEPESETASVGEKERVEEKSEEIKEETKPEMKEENQ